MPIVSRTSSLSLSPSSISISPAKAGPRPANLSGLCLYATEKQNSDQTSLVAHTKPMGDYCRGLTAHSTLRGSACTGIHTREEEARNAVQLTAHSTLRGSACTGIYTREEEARNAVQCTGAHGDMGETSASNGRLLKS